MNPIFFGLLGNARAVIGSGHSGVLKDTERTPPENCWDSPYSAGFIVPTSDIVPVILLGKTAARLSKRIGTISNSARVWFTAGTCALCTHWHCYVPGSRYDTAHRRTDRCTESCRLPYIRYDRVAANLSFPLFRLNSRI